MAYIGIPPKINFSSGLLDRFTGTTGTTVTLTNDISSENDIIVFVNFVKQDSTTYSVGGTGNKTLTLGGTLVSSDIVEVHYVNEVGQTVAPSAGSVGSSQLTADSITGQTAETSIATDDTILIHDTSASALRKMTRANFVSGIGGANTPNFFVEDDGAQSINHDTITKLNFATENFDSDSAFASNKFTVPSGKAGKYFLYASWQSASSTDFNEQRIYIYKNGSSIGPNIQGYHDHYGSIQISCLENLSVSDYIEVYAYQNAGGSINTLGTSKFLGYKIIE